MYTRCPHCQTVFSLTPAQLKARDGLVRCGRCQNTFRADRSLLDGPLQAVADAPARTRKSKGATGTTRRRDKRAAAAVAEVLPLPTTRIVRTRAVFWWLGNLLLLGVLAAQGLYFYGDALVEYEPRLRPVAAEFCEWAGCRLRPRQDVALIDLADAHVEPHPRYDRALRVHAVLVNRAEFSQPHPEIEITLTNRDGAVVTRRSFVADEYLGPPGTRATAMPPGLAVDVQLDLTQPEAITVGYEIRLLPAR